MDNEDNNVEAMTNTRGKSRQRWEKEIRARQQNITPADYPEGLHYVRGDHLPKIVSQSRFWLGIVLMAVGVKMFFSTIPVWVSVAAGAGIAAGFLLTITAMRFDNER